MKLLKLKWVHRDVSIGSILCYTGGGNLGDLEYAKRIGDTTSHDMCMASRVRLVIWWRTEPSQQGTMHFMSIEVFAQLFLFPPDEFAEPTDFDSRLARQIEKKNCITEGTSCSTVYSYLLA